MAQRQFGVTVPARVLTPAEQAGIAAVAAAGPYPALPMNSWGEVQDVTGPQEAAILASLDATYPTLAPFLARALPVVPAGGGNVSTAGLTIGRIPVAVGASDLGDSEFAQDADQITVATRGLSAQRLTSVGDSPPKTSLSLGTNDFYLNNVKDIAANAAPHTVFQSFIPQIDISILEIVRWNAKIPTGGASGSVKVWRMISIDVSGAVLTIADMATFRDDNTGAGWDLTFTAVPTVIPVPGWDLTGILTTDTGVQTQIAINAYVTIVE